MSLIFYNLNLTNLQYLGERVKNDDGEVGEYFGSAYLI